MFLYSTRTDLVRANRSDGLALGLGGRLGRLRVDLDHPRGVQDRVDAGVDEDDDTAYMAPANYLEDRRFDPAVLLENSDWEDNSVSNLESALEKLDDRSRDILQKRWLNEEKATLHELAAEYGVSAERIRQLEKNAMKKVRGMIEV